MYCLWLFWVILPGFLFYSPILLVLFLIVLLSFCVLLMATVTKDYFFSYVMFLLFMSGLIMVLMYFCSIVLNEKFSLYFDFTISVLFLTLAVYILGIHLNLNYLFSFNFFKTSYFGYENLIKYLVYPYSIYSLFFISYLLLCLIVVYEIVKKCSGPLRVKS